MYGTPGTQSIAAIIAARRPAQKDRADLIIERCEADSKAYAERTGGDASVRLAHHVGQLQQEVRGLVAEIGDADIPRDPCLTYNRVRRAGVDLELGWQWKYRCVEVVEAWHGGQNIAALLGDTALAVLADHLVHEVL
jgi:hypothetical protein